MKLKSLCCVLRRPRSQDVVRCLDYSHSNFNCVPTEIFSYERTLEALVLESNRIQQLPKVLFFCHNLRILNLMDNELIMIPDAISNLTSMEDLNISRNGILQIPESIKSCKKLQILEISVNPLRRISEAITGLPNLTQLYLNDTMISCLPATIGRLTKLEVLEARENHITSLPSSLSLLRDLLRLDLGVNEFTELPPHIGDLASLQECWCDQNLLHSLPPDIGRLQQLVFLDASKNSLTSICERLTECSSLADLHFGLNVLTHLPASLGRLSKLSLLDANDNKIVELPASIGGLSNLSEIHVKNNELSTLPSAIGMLRNLRTLLVDENLITQLPKEIGTCSGLTVLSLYGNLLAGLPDSMGNMTQLKVLNVTNNRLHHLPYTLIKLQQLQSLWLVENQTKPLIRLQAEHYNGHKVLTCYVLPQTSSAAAVSAATPPPPAAAQHPPQHPPQHQHQQYQQQQYQQQQQDSQWSTDKRRMIHFDNIDSDEELLRSTIARVQTPRLPVRAKQRLQNGAHKEHIQNDFPYSMNTSYADDMTNRNHTKLDRNRLIQGEKMEHLMNTHKKADHYHVAPSPSNTRYNPHHSDNGTKLKSAMKFKPDSMLSDTEMYMSNNNNNNDDHGINGGDDVGANAMMVNTLTNGDDYGDREAFSSNIASHNNNNRRMDADVAQALFTQLQANGCLQADTNYSRGYESDGGRGLHRPCNGQGQRSVNAPSSTSRGQRFDTAPSRSTGYHSDTGGHLRRRQQLYFQPDFNADNNWQRNNSNSVHYHKSDVGVRPRVQGRRDMQEIQFAEAAIQSRRRVSTYSHQPTANHIDKQFYHGSNGPVDSQRLTSTRPLTSSQPTLHQHSLQNNLRNTESYRSEPRLKSPATTKQPFEEQRASQFTDFDCTTSHLYNEPVDPERNGVGAARGGGGDLGPRGLGGDLGARGVAGVRRGEQPPSHQAPGNQFQDHDVSAPRISSQRRVPKTLPQSNQQPSLNPGLPLDLCRSLAVDPAPASLHQQPHHQHQGQRVRRREQQQEQEEKDCAPVHLRTNRVATFAGRPVSMPQCSFAKQRSLPSTSLRSHVPHAIDPSAPTQPPAALPLDAKRANLSVPVGHAHSGRDSGHPSNFAQHQAASSSLTPVRPAAPTSTTTAAATIAATTSSADTRLSHNPAHFVAHQKSQKLLESSPGQYGAGEANASSLRGVFTPSASQLSSPVGTSWREPLVNVAEDEDADEDEEWTQMMADHDLTPTNHDLAALTPAPDIHDPQTKDLDWRRQLQRASVLLQKTPQVGDQTTSCHVTSDQLQPAHETCSTTATTTTTTATPPTPATVAKDTKSAMNSAPATSTTTTTPPLLPMTPMTPVSALPHHMSRGHVAIEDLQVVDNRRFYRHGTPNTPAAQATPTTHATPMTHATPTTHAAPNTPMTKLSQNNSKISYPQQTLSQTPSQPPLQTISSPEIHSVHEAGSYEHDVAIFKPKKAQITSSTDSGYAAQELRTHIDGVAAVPALPISNLTTPVSGTPVATPFNSPRPLIDGAAASSITSGRTGKPIPVEIFHASVRKNPGLGFSIAGGVDSQCNPYRSCDNGIFVTMVTPNGPAHQILKSGDKILRVNGMDFTSIVHSHAVSALCSLTGVVDLLVERLC